MKKLRVTTIVGTRPEIIRLSCVIKFLDEHFDHRLIHTGQNYDFELNEIFFNDLGIRVPDYFLNAAGIDGADTIGQVISKTSQLFRDDAPDAVLILGDTNSCMSAIAAKRHKIPIFHMEAGNRCFDMRVPEEINRRVVDHLADINLTYSSIARDYLISEGLPADRIIKTGSPMREILESHSSKIQSSQIKDRLGLEKDKYVLASIHREENLEIEKNFNRITSLLNELAERYGLPIIVSTHPRTRKKLDASAVDFDSLLQFIKPLSFTDYCHLQMNAKVVISDSGTITEEASILNFPAVNLRETHERPEGMEEASVIMSGLDLDNVIQSIELAIAQPTGDRRAFSLVADYSPTNVSQKVGRIIQSYTHYVNRTVWRVS